MSDIRVLTVDDQLVFLTAARDLIASTSGFTLVGEAVSGREALDTVERLAPDLVLLDIRMPDLDGIETARRMTARPGHPVVLLVSAYDSEAVRELAKRSGAADVILKERLRPGVLRKFWETHGAHRGLERAST